MAVLLVHVAAIATCMIMPGHEPEPYAGRFLAIECSSVLCHRRPTRWLRKKYETGLQLEIPLADALDVSHVMARGFGT